MPVFEWRSTIPVSADELYAWHARPGAFERLGAPWQAVHLVEHTGGIADGGRLAIQYRGGLLPGHWVAVHEDNEPGRRFVDRQVDGPFAAWRHEHRFVAQGEHACEMEDHVDYKLPLGAGALGGAMVRHYLERLFRFRHERLRHDLARHAAFADRPRLTVAIGGASGMIGSQLCTFLTTGGHEVRRLVRRAPAAADEVFWDPVHGEIDAAGLQGIDAVINLAGENIGQRWTPAVRRDVLASREKGTKLLARTVATLDPRPRVFVGASAVGFYGGSLDDVELTEKDPSGSDFLAEVCRAWERATLPAAEAGIEVATPRFGVVMSAREGALARQLTPYKFGGGGPVGSGDQWLSWIAPDDLLGVLNLLLFDDGLRGAVNAVSPQPVKNREFARALGRVLHRPALLPLPRPVVRGVFGQMGDVMLLRGQRVLPARLQEHGFEWWYPEIEGALRFELGRMAEPAEG
jgi:uncharacterized protein